MDPSIATSRRVEMEMELADGVRSIRGRSRSSSAGALKCSDERNGCCCDDAAVPASRTIGGSRP